MRFGGWLALFALGLQLTLSFGHIHAEDFAAAKTAVAQNQTPPQNAPDGDHDGNDVCAICAVMHMAGTSAMPVAPSISVPSDFVFVAFVTSERTELPPPARLSFQARAPPQA
ncbi:MAG TPA: DUF2946 domain-containing protein [Pseudolabrys sp.]